jgi:5,10-methylenetetrahydrofolate reductase
MVKISDKIKKAEREGRPWWSFEFFPCVISPAERPPSTALTALSSSTPFRPKTPEGWVNLYDRIERMQQLGPIFVDITYVQLRRRRCRHPSLTLRLRTAGEQAARRLKRRPTLSRRRTASSVSKRACT